MRGLEGRSHSALAPVVGFDDVQLGLLARLARKRALEICLAAENGHIGASSGAAELFVVLYLGGILRFDPGNSNHPMRDRVLVRGHLGPLRYTVFSWFGWIGEEELPTYRTLGSRLHGHEDHLAVPGVDITPSGSLGMLLSYGVGCAAAARDMNKDFRTWVFVGDGEEQEGVVSEAARHGAHLGLSNLIAVIDRNGKQLSNTVATHDSADIGKVWAGYGWSVIEISDGNDIESVLRGYRSAIAAADLGMRPTVIIANTVKGRHIIGAEEHYSGYHTISRVPLDVVRKSVIAIDETIDKPTALMLTNSIHQLSTTPKPFTELEQWVPTDIGIMPSDGVVNNPDACQQEFFKLFSKHDLLDSIKDAGSYFLTADVTTVDATIDLCVDSSFIYYNTGLREQHTVAMAHGISVTRPSARILINSLDAFTYRCIDQICAALQGQSSMVILGDVSGLTNSRNGRTHQSTGLPAALLSMHGLIFLEPWDATDTFACLNWALGQSRGIVYVRVHSSTVPVLVADNIQRALTYYSVTGIIPDTKFVLISSGLTVSSCIEASAMLEKDGISARVINIVNAKSLDKNFVDLIPENVPVLLVYNGHPEVLESAVCRAFVRYGHGSCTLDSIGYTDGATGRLPEILNLFGLDGIGVYTKAKAVISAESLARR